MSGKLALLRATAPLADRRLGIGVLLLREVALPGESLLVGGEERWEADEPDPHERGETDDHGQQDQEVVEHKERLDDDQAERDQARPPQPFPHLEIDGVAMERTGPDVVEDDEHHQEGERGDPGRVEDVREVRAVERDEEILPGGESHEAASTIVWMGPRSMPCQAVYSARSTARRRVCPGPAARP